MVDQRLPAEEIAGAAARAARSEAAGRASTFAVEAHYCLERAAGADHAARAAIGAGCGDLAKSLQNVAERERGHAAEFYRLAASVLDMEISE